MKHKVYKLKNDAQITRHVQLKKGEEFMVRNDVVYMNGFPISFDVQEQFLAWVKANMDSLIDVTGQY